MKSEAVLATFRAFMDGDADRATDLMRQIIANEQRNNNLTLARRIESMLNRPQMIRLPNAPPSLAVIQPTRELSTLVLNDGVRKSVDQLVAEWRCRDALTAHGLKPRNVVFLHGPSGCGKTQLAEAIARELGMPFGMASHSELVDSHLGCTSRNIDTLFKFLSQTPCMAFIDEADSLITERVAGARDSQRENNRVVNTLLMAFDRLPASSIVVMATNMAGTIDSALVRRIGLSLELPAPDHTDRAVMIAVMLDRYPVLKSAGTEWQATARSAESYAKIESLAMDAARAAVIAGAPTDADLFPDRPKTVNRDKLVEMSEA